MSNRPLASAIVALLFLAAVRAPVDAETNRATTLVAVAAALPPPASATFDDPIWATALTASGFTDFTTRRPAPRGTTAYVLYDRTNLYVGFVAEQRGLPLVATTTTNDTGSGVDDSVSVVLDTSGVGSRVYTFGTNPRGVRFESSSESARYRPRWTAYTQATPEGWNAQLVVPLAVLRGEAGATQSWRINLVRHVAGTNEDYTWAYDANATSPYDPTYFPLLTKIAVASQATRPQPRADLYALGSGGSDRRRFQTAAGTFEDRTPRALGIDATVPFTNTLAFVGTLNPDFSNVETDQQTIAPQEFRLGLSEYRPFFSQGVKTLEPFSQISLNGPADSAFYTPGIGAFDRGAKIEGTVDTQSIGALEVRGAGFDDSAYGYSYGTRDKSLSFQFGSVQAHHDIGNDTTDTIGFTRRNIRSGEATIVLDRSESGTFVTDRSLAHNFSLVETIMNQQTTAFVGYKDVGPQYAPIDGYTRLNDIRGPQVLYLDNGVGSGRIKSYALALYAERLLDRSGAVHEASVFGQASVTFPNLFTIGGGPSTSELRTYDAPYPFYINPRTFRFNQHTISLGYRDGTSAPLDATYTFGPFAIACAGAMPQPQFCGAFPILRDAYLQQIDVTSSRSLGPYAIAAEYSTASERPVLGLRDGQALRRISVTRSIGTDTTFSLALRSINGMGGNAAPGTNLSASLHARFHSGDELFVNFGTPAADRTLNRAILKYVFHVGSASGT